MKHISYFKESVFSSFPKTFESDILSLNDSPEFKREKVVLSPSTIAPKRDFIKKVKSSINESEKLFSVSFNKGYRYSNRSHHYYIELPNRFKISSAGGKEFKLTYIFGGGRYFSKPNINIHGFYKLSEIKDQIKSDILLCCKLFDEYQKNQSLVSKEADDSFKKEQKQMEIFKNKVNHKFIMDQFSNIFDLCEQYEIGKPHPIKGDGVNVVIRMQSNVTILRPGSDKTDVTTRVDNKFIDFYSELMTTSERLSENGILMDIKGGPQVIFAFLKLKDSDVDSSNKDNDPKDYDPEFDGEPAHHRRNGRY